jgi:hypothetical protein
MKKKILQYGLLGFPIGVFFSYFITIIISLLWAGGHYYPVVPTFVKACGNEIKAVVVQFFLSGILGSACAVGSLVWQMERWSTLKQTVIHFFVMTLSILPIVYIARWIEHSFKGIASYFGGFIFIYVIVWVVQYFILKEKIKKINGKIKK